MSDKVEKVVVKNKKEFKATVDDKEITLFVIRPTVKIQKEAGDLRSKRFSESVSNGAMLRCELDTHMKKRKLWDKDKQKELEKLDDSIDKLILSLKKGGIKLSEGKKLAFEIKKLRSERRDLLSERVSLDSSTAEGQAENESLSYIVSRCILNEEGNPYFKTYDDFIENRNSDPARKGFSAYIELISDINTDFENELPENKFLHSYNFIDKKGRFINKEGKLVDVDGKLVDEKGRWINEKGEYVDKNGDLVDEQGNYIVETLPFLDDDGNVVEVQQVETPKT